MLLSISAVGFGPFVHLGGDLMVTSSKWLMTGSPARCAFCDQPFRSRDGYPEFWRASNGHHFCSEFCAADAEEAYFRTHRSRPR
jgi:hypothetical protein